MRREDFQLIPIYYRMNKLQSTKDEDIFWYTLNRYTGLSLSLLKKLSLTLKFIKDEIHLKGSAALLINIADSLATYEIQPLVFESITSEESQIILPLNLFFTKSI